MDRVEREIYELVREGRRLFQPQKDTWCVWTCVMGTWWSLQARELLPNQSSYWQCVLFSPLCLAVSMDSTVGQAWWSAGLIWVLAESRRVHSGCKMLRLLHLSVAVGDLGDFCPPFFIFFTRQLGHKLFICYSSLVPTSWFCVSSVFMIIES